MTPADGARWVFGGFGWGRTVHRALIWDGRRQAVLKVTESRWGPVARRSWTWS